MGQLANCMEIGDGVGMHSTIGIVWNAGSNVSEGKKVLSRTVGGTDTIVIEDDIDSIFYDHTNDKLEITIKSIPNFERSIQWSIDTNTGISEKATHNAAYGVGLYKYRCFPQQKS